jgi:hypothetical protein
VRTTDYAAPKMAMIAALTRQLPPEERFGLAQILRSARFIHANIAEGHGRRTRECYLRCYRISCLMNSIGNWSSAATVSCGMRTMQQLRAQQASRGASEAKRHRLHHAQAQAQGQRGKERGGSTSGTQVPWLQLHHMGPKRRIADKALMRFKRKVRELTNRTRGISIEQMSRGENWPPIFADGKPTSASVKRPRCWSDWIDG